MTDGRVEKLIQRGGHVAGVRPGIGGTKPVMETCPVMPSSRDSLLRSVRRWLLVTVFLLGIGVIGIADIAYTVSDYADGPVPAVIGVTGGLIALVAGLRTLGTLSSTG